MFQTRSKDACSTQEKDFLRSDLFFTHYILWLTASGPVGRHGPLTRWCLMRLLGTSASKRSIRRFVITEKAPTRAFSWLKAATNAFTFKTLLRHYAKRALTPRSLNVKLGPRRKGHKGRAAIRHYANQTARP